MTSDQTKLRPATRLVHGGVQRSQHGETAEALYLTSGYVYDDAARSPARAPEAVPSSKLPLRIKFFHYRGPPPAPTLPRSFTRGSSSSSDSIISTSGQTRVSSCLACALKPAPTKRSPAECANATSIGESPTYKQLLRSMSLCRSNSKIPEIADL
jgi:hypothetical protein